MVFKICQKSPQWIETMVTRLKQFLVYLPWSGLVATLPQ